MPETVTDEAADVAASVNGAVALPQDKDASPRESEDKKPTGLTIARRTAAGGLLLAWMVVAWISYQTPYLQSCSDQIVRVGNSPLVRSCDPLSLLDAPMLVLLVAAAFLLLPDVSSIEIPGIFRLEREVAEQKRRQDDLIRMIQNLKVEQHVYVNERAETAVEAARLVQENAGKFRQFQDYDEQLRQTPSARDEQPGDDTS